MPSLNWFSLNRPDGGPAYFSAQNRIEAPVWLSWWFFCIVISVAALLVILIILSPPLKHRWTTLSLVTTSLLMGGALLLSFTLPAWQTAEGRIRASIKVWDIVDQDLNIGIHLGLDNVNITLQKAPVVPQTDDQPTAKKPVVLPRLLPRDSTQVINEQPESSTTIISTTASPALTVGTTTSLPVAYTTAEDIRFNEQIKLETSYDMREQMKESLQRGLPVPILTVIQYFTHQEEGFRWSVDFRTAGFYCQFVLICTLSVWALMNALLLAVPRYGALTMILVGFLALLAVLIYCTLLPDKPMIIHINGQVIQFRWGECFWTVMVTGIVACVVGTYFYVSDVLQPGALTFDFEMENEMAKSSFDQMRKNAFGPAQSEGHPEVKEDFKRSSKVTIKESDSFKQGDSGISGNDSVITDRPDSLEKTAPVRKETPPSTTSADEASDEDDKPKTIGYTFRNGRELPSFHESTISLNSQGINRFYMDSIVEETVQVHRSVPEEDSESETEEWQDPQEELVPPAKLATPSARRLRRSVRNPSIGSHKDIVGQ